MMERDALEYLVTEVSDIQLVEIDGHTYSDKQLNRIDEPTEETLQLSTLSSLVDYVNKFSGDRYIVHINSPTTVTVRSMYYRDDKTRSVDCICKPDLPNLQLDRFLDLESFNIMLQSVFVQTPDLQKVLSVVGNVQTENVQSIDDDGITQQVAIRTGIARKGEAIVPNPVVLAPYRTFVELEQPESSFVLRMKDGPSAALFEADGGAWRMVAIELIKDYLLQNISSGNVLILA